MPQICEYINQYKLCEVLGAGSYGTVHRAEKLGISYAMKCLSKKRLKRKGFGATGCVTTCQSHLTRPQQPCGGV